MNVSYCEILFAGSILLLPFLYETNHVFRYYLKFCVYYVVVMFNSVLMVPLFMFRPRNVHNLVLAAHVCSIVSPLIGLKWIVKGEKHLEKERACIIVANHQSSLDVLGLFHIWPTMGKCTVIAKNELMYAGPFGLASWLAGLVFIPRLQSDKAKDVMNEAVKKIKVDKTKLLIFPEGTRRNTGQIHPYKKGAFHLAISGQIPILPLVFSRYYFLDKHTKRFDHGKILLTALSPIDTKGLTQDNLDELMQDVQEKMTKAFHEGNRALSETGLLK